MAIKRDTNIPSFIEEVKYDDLVIDKDVSYTEFEQIWVRSQFDAHLIYIGHVSGKRYEWRTSGTAVEVDARDVDELLSKRLGEGSCCGSASRGNVLFCLD